MLIVFSEFFLLNFLVIKNMDKPMKQKRFLYNNIDECKQIKVITISVLDCKMHTSRTYLRY